MESTQNQTKEWLAEHAAWEALKPIRFLKTDKTEDKTILTLFDRGSQVVIDKQRQVVYRLYQHHFRVNPHHFRVNPHKDFPNLPYNPQVRLFTLFASHSDWTDPFRYPYQLALQAAQKVIDEAVKNDESFRKDLMDKLQKISKHDVRYDHIRAYMKMASRIAHKVANSKFSFSLDKLRGMFGGILWKELDPDILKLTTKAFGAFANSFDYTLVWKNPAQVEEALRIAPGCLSIWRFLMWNEMQAMRDFRIAREQERKKHERGTANFLRELGAPEEELADTDFLNELQAMAGENVFRDPDASYKASPDLMDGWKELVDYTNEPLKCDNIVRMVKDYFDQHKLSSRGWKYLITMSPHHARRFVRVSNRFGDLIDYLDLMASTGCRLRYSMIVPILMDIMQYRRADGRSDRGSLSALLRSACEAMQKKRGVKNWYNQEYSLVWDWWRQTWPVTDSNQRRIGWSWYMREQAAWHEEVTRRKREAVAKEYWESSLPTQEINGYEVVPLTTSLDLFDEGKDMHHCVGSYANRCKMNESRIFSIRKDGEKVATMELSNLAGWDYASRKKHTDGKKWNLAQVRGHCNKEADKTTRSVAEEVVKRYNDAEEKSRDKGTVAS